MRNVLRAGAVVVCAFILTSAIMFWLPAFERTTGWVTAGYTDYHFYPDIVDTYSPDKNIRALKKLSPLEERERIDEISAELKTKTNSDLFKMKAFDDVCTNNLIDCQSLTSSKVKPFIDATLLDRQDSQTAFFSMTTNIISAGSLFLSCIALIFTALTYFAKSHTGAHDGVK